MQQKGRALRIRFLWRQKRVSPAPSLVSAPGPGVGQGGWGGGVLREHADNTGKVGTGRGKGGSQAPVRTWSPSLEQLGAGGCSPTWTHTSASRGSLQVLLVPRPLPGMAGPTRGKNDALEAGEWHRATSGTFQWGPVFLTDQENSEQSLDIWISVFHIFGPLHDINAVDFELFKVGMF